MELQSGIVFAVIIGAVLLVDRLGGNDELARRLFQVALGVALATLVLTATTAFIRSSGGSGVRELLTTGSSSAESRDIANRYVAARSVEFSLGVLALLFGIGGLRRWSTVPIGVTIGGLLLIISAGTEASTAYALLAQSTLAASMPVNVFNVALMALGTGTMVWYGFTTWDSEDEEVEGEDITSPA